MVFLQYKAELEHPFLKAAYKQCYFYSADKGLKTTRSASVLWLTLSSLATLARYHL